MSRDTIDYKALSEAEILRRHMLYQRSYTGYSPAHANTISPMRRGKTPRPKLVKRVNNSMPGEMSPIAKRDKSPVRKLAQSASEVLDIRRQSRTERSRPWKDKVPKSNKKNTNSFLFYDRILPTNMEASDILLRPRRYVSNSKYGDIYELRRETPKKQEKAPLARKWLWEDEFLLWQKGSRDKYLEETGNKTKASTTSMTGSFTSRADHLPTIKEHQQRPSADLYASYHYNRLERTTRKLAAVQVQKVYRGWHVRSLLKTLKRKALLEHGKPWIKFLADYKELVAKIRSRYGKTWNACAINMKQIAEFMDKTLKYKNAFDQVASNGKLRKDDLMELFNRCDLWPTQRDINRCFDTMFRGSRNTAEVVFVLDCSSSIGVIGFHNLVKLLKDIVMSLDIAPDRTRVGVVPFNEDVFSSFGFTTFSEKNDILAAISLIKNRNGLTRTDTALRFTRNMLRDSRPGVQQIAIVITDGKSTEPDRTEAESEILHKLGVQVITIGVGDKADMDELRQLATSSDNCFNALDIRSLAYIRSQTEKRLCLYNDIIRATGMKACFRLVVKAKLDREGFVTIPSSDVKDGIEKATSKTQVMKVVENYIRSKQGVL